MKFLGNGQTVVLIRSNKKKYLCLGSPDATYIYWLNLEFFSGFLEKKIILCILKCEMPFKIFIKKSEKMIIKNQIRSGCQDDPKEKLRYKAEKYFSV